MSEFEEFMKNPYWRELYENAPENVKKYYKLKWSPDPLKEWTDEELIEDKKQFDAIKNTFSKEDWEYLIKHSHGRFKYYATKDMNKRFPPVENLQDNYSEVKDWILRKYMEMENINNVDDLTDKQEQIYMSYVEKLTKNPEAVKLINKDINGEFPTGLTLTDLFIILKTE